MMVKSQLHSTTKQRYFKQWLNFLTSAKQYQFRNIIEGKAMSANIFLDISENSHTIISNKQQATSNKQQATSNKQQATSNKQQVSSWRDCFFSLPCVSGSGDR
jgi:hypothetical protein